MMNRSRLTNYLIFIALIFFSVNIHAEPKVVASLKPIHSLVSALMQGAGTPQLLLNDTQSPHHMSLRPSQIRMLNDADLIIWIGGRLEPALSHLMEQQQDRSKVIELIELPDLHLLPIRDRRAWHSHGEESHGDHSHGTPAAHAKMVDHHIWLSPENAIKIVLHLRASLQQLDPTNSEIYQQNSQQLVSRIEKLDARIQTDLAQVKHLPYIVFHDAYQYFEAHFGLDAVGSVSIDPDQLSGARHVLRLRDTIRRTGARCIFTEPQFEPKLARALVEDTPANTGQLDPLGSQHKAGADSYFLLMQALSDSLLDCLSQESTE
jgi:zinc transport system substrate-binding protein